MSEGEGEQALIRNCRFAFRCHQRWQALERTGDPRLRYCHECSRPVVLCRSDSELRAALESDECVALPVAAWPEPLVGVVTIGSYRTED